MEQSSALPSKNLEGLGGWLGLVIFGLFLSLLRTVIELAQLYAPLLSIDLWKNFIDKHSELYNPFLAAFIAMEAVGNACILALNVAAIVYFFQRKALFPKIYIIWITVAFAITLFDAMVASHLFPDIVAFDPETTKSLSQTGFTALIWIPYMLVSKRVAATFVN